MDGRIDQSMNPIEDRSIMNASMKLCRLNNNYCYLLIIRCGCVVHGVAPLGSIKASNAHHFSVYLFTNILMFVRSFVLLKLQNGMKKKHCSLHNETLGLKHALFYFHAVSFSLFSLSTIFSLVFFHQILMRHINKSRRFFKNWIQRKKQPTTWRRYIRKSWPCACIQPHCVVFLFRIVCDGGEKGGRYCVIRSESPQHHCWLYSLNQLCVCVCLVLACVCVHVRVHMCVEICTDRIKSIRFNWA